MHDLVERFLVGRTDRQTIAKHSSGKDRSLGILAVAAAALLGMGVAAPFATVENFYGLEGQYSIVTAALEMLKTGNGVYSLGALVLFVAIPIVSIATAFDLWYKHVLHGDKVEKFISRAHLCGRLWFLVMLATISLIFYVKTSSTGTIMHLSVYYMLLSVILQKLVLSRMTALFARVQFEEE